MKPVVLGAAGGMALGLALVARTTLRVPLVDPALESTPSLVSSLPSPAWVLLAAAAGALGGGLLGLRRREHLVTPYLACGLAFAIYVPGAFSAAPFLAAFSGAFLDFALAASTLVAIGRFVAGGGMPGFRLSPNAVALVSFVVYLFVGLELSESVGLSGDEPHFVLVTYSILHDFDIRVQDNYGNEDYRQFYNGKIGPHLAVGTPYSVHGVGVSILLLPGFALGGLFGVVVTEALLSALVLRSLFGMAFELTSSTTLSLVATVAFGLTAPALFLSVSAYPELPAALIVTGVARRLLSPAPPSAAAGLFCVLAAGALPFLHVKFSPLAALLVLALAFRFRGNRPALRAVALGAGAAAAMRLAFAYATLGSIDPTASYGSQRMFLERLPLGVGGLLFDQEFGLLACSPVYLLGLAGLASLSRRSALLGAVAVGAFLAVLLPGAAHPLWSGGSSPPGRFLYPALPLLMAGAACLLQNERQWGVGAWAPSLVAASLSIAGAMFFLPGQPLYLNGRNGRGRVWEALSSSWDLTDYLPSLVRADPRSVAWAVGLGLFVLAVVGAQVAKRRLPLPPSIVLLLLGAFVQDWTSVRRSTTLESAWALGALRQLFDRREEEFTIVPGRGRLGAMDVAARMSVPLSPDPLDSDPAYWWSRSYSLPAGRFLASGVPPGAVSFCNGGSCFASGEIQFSSRVALARFQLRTTGLLKAPRIRLLEPLPSESEAVRTLAVGEGARLHGLDDQSYLDPGGFWVQKSATAAFAFENGEEPGPRVLRLANGGVENRAEVRSESSGESFPLAAWEERELVVPGRGLVVSFSIRSESGFRPVDLDPESSDQRPLGVLLRASPPFD